MFGRYPVSSTIREWILENFDWAIRHGLLTGSTQLVLPTPEFFRAKTGEPADVAQALLDDLKGLLGLEGERIDLVPLDVMSEEHRLDYNALSGVAGTWQDDADTATIRYDPVMIKRPLSLISTLAHELMHHVLHRIDEFPPGGPETEELATDLHVITMGMGVIQLSGAEQTGWQGYMSQPARAHAMALFLASRGIAPDAALAHLPPRSAKYLRRAVKEVDRSGEAQEVLERL